MINKYLIILFFFNTALLQEKMFWDFQLKIIESKNTKNKQINNKAMISNIYVKPTLLDNNTSKNLSNDLKQLSIEEKINMANQFLLIESYDMAAKYYLDLDFNLLDSKRKESTIYSCAYALYASAQFNEAANFIKKYNLNHKPKNLILECLILSETNIELAIKKLNYLIQDFPNNEFTNTAKIQLKLLKSKI